MAPRNRLAVMQPLMVWPVSSLTTVMAMNWGEVDVSCSAAAKAPCVCAGNVCARAAAGRSRREDSSSMRRCGGVMDLSFPVCVVAGEVIQKMRRFFEKARVPFVSGREDVFDPATEQFGQRKGQRQAGIVAPGLDGVDGLTRHGELVGQVGLAPALLGAQFAAGVFHGVGLFTNRTGA